MTYYIYIVIRLRVLVFLISWKTTGKHMIFAGPHDRAILVGLQHQWFPEQLTLDGLQGIRVAKVNYDLV
uniref:Putative secreted protein n=1 Tax=Xenopsylla cheopis TaxID=163159 RepID=A0A6M2DVB3_XENCH